MLNPLLIFATPLSAAAACLFLKSKKSISMAATVLACLHSFVAVYTLWPLLAGNASILTFYPELSADRTSACFIVLTSIVAAAAISHAQIFFAREESGSHPPDLANVRQFYVLAFLFLLAMTFVYVFDNLGFLWMSIEATTLVSAGLVYFHRTKDALEATWKYFIICSVGIAFALLGTIFIFAASQYAIDEGTLTISRLIEMAPRLNVPLLKLGFVFAFLGYGTKAGIFPLHSWLPDAHSEAPAPASAMLSGSLLNCALYAIWRLTSIVDASRHFSSAREIVVWAGALTVIAAGIFLVRQHGIKRLWAYSSIENVGLMALAIGLGSLPLFLLQALNHSLAKVALFLLSGNIIQSAGTKQLKDLRGMFYISPFWGILFMLAACAVTGAPPFGAFISEWLILARGAEFHEVGPVALVIAGLALSFIAVSVHVGQILLGTPRKGVAGFSPILSSLIPCALLVCTLLLGFVISPSLVASFK